MYRNGEIGKKQELRWQTAVLTRRVTARRKCSFSGGCPHIGACRPTVQLEHLVSVHEDSLTALERNRH
jgi:hypothetical protein